MRASIVRKGLLVATAAGALGAFGAAPADAASCKPVVNPYQGTRYEGVDLRRIHAHGVRCSKARRVVERAHGKALGITPPPSGIRRFTWHGWTVRGDLRPPTDRYVARRHGNRIRWVF
jgi:hypothetical protein